MKSCGDCQYAHKSGSEDHVFCTLWQNRCNEANMSAEHFVRQVIYAGEKPSEVSLGWGFPHKHMKADTHWSTKGTATEGLMWNNQICVPKDDKCDFFKPYVHNLSALFK
jgi:hypothetical protein